ncbi:MAG TPA: OmpA family protein [Vicinamibacteria bacterium]|nr:OmpA family protein [Vicinamibacteria bacterium]
MSGRWTALALGGFLVLTGTSWADGTSGDAADKKDGAACTVKKEEVKTWTMTVDGQEWEVRPATPSYEGDTGLFHLSSAYTLPKGKASVSVFRQVLNRDPKDINFAIFGLSLAYGATDRLELFGDVGIQNRVDADALFQPGFYNDLPGVTTPWQSGFGDVKLGGKFKFLDDYRGEGVGLALKAAVKFGTADETLGLGTGKTSFAADLILSKSLDHHADLHGSLGYEFNSSPDAVKIGNAFKWGVGLNFPSCSKIQLQAEVTGRSYSSADSAQTNPVDVVIGPVFFIKPGFFIRPALSWNANFNDRGSNQGFKSYSDYEVSIGYHPGTRCCQVYVPPPPPPPPTNRNPTVNCEIEKSQILPGETVRCRAVASDPDGDPLTYSWTASSGRVTGTGTEAVFDSAGVPPGTTVSVTVSVSDGRGGTAQSVCSVRVQAPEKPRPEPVTCTSGGFPRNLARLNNVDKACLDDVASKLKQDPRSRVIIVGHADSNERYPEVIGRKRAEAVKSYLVKERGIEEARITAKSAGASKPLDTGTSAAARAKNRRVDVIFVPEGATPPEDDD